MGCCLFIHRTPVFVCLKSRSKVKCKLVESCSLEKLPRSLNGGAKRGESEISSSMILSDAT